MKMRLLLICLLFTTANSMWANGGGIAYYGVNSAGNPYFKDFPEVKILREDLVIRPVGDRIDIRVTYLMHNTSGKELKELHYAFPVDFWCQLNRDIANGKWYYPPLNPEKEMAEAVKHIEFICNGKTLPYQAEVPNRMKDEDTEHSISMRTWYFTDIDLPRGVSQLIVNYSIESESFIEMGGLGKYANFNYDFSPAGTFGDSKIKELSITVDATDIAISDINFNAGPYLFTKHGEVYTYTQTDFDLKNVQPLSISFNHTNNEAELLINNIPENDLIIKTSSSTSQYPIANLTDLDFGSAFIFAKNGGIGQWIEITAKNKTAITSIGFLGGYYKSQDTYRNNNRIKKVLVEYLSVTGAVMDSQEEEFTDKPYKQLDYSNFYENMVFPFTIDYDYFEYYDKDGKPIEDWMPGTVRITILEVYKGDKFNDTCISELIVTGEE